MKKIAVYILAVLILSSCRANKLLGIYSFSKSVNNVNVHKKLTLEKNSGFRYYYYASWHDGVKESKSVDVSGFGLYKIEKDSIYLSFKRKDFELDEIEFNEIYEKHSKTNKQELDISITFTDAYGVRILKNNKEISRSDIDGIASFKVDIKELPLELTFDFTESNLSMYKNYKYQLVSAVDYEIFVTINDPIMFKKNLVFLISKDLKKEYRIGEMSKNVR